MDKYVKKFSKKATKAFKGKTVEKIDYLTDEEAENMGWFRKAPVVTFTDGSYLIASSDPEGNDAGTLFTSNDDVATLGPI